MEKKEIPTDILRTIESSEMYSKLGEIGKTYNLLLDQVGQLEVDTRMVMIGNIKSDKFVETIAQNLEISEETAEKISADINNEIFSSLRESLIKMQGMAEEKKEIDNSPLEQAGNFTLEKVPTPGSAGYNETGLKREDILKQIEEVSTEKSAENFVDHLLANPISSPEQVEVKKEAAVPSSPAQSSPPPKKYAADPYREPF